MAAAHNHSVHGKAFSSLGIPLAPLTQDSCFYEDHVVVTAQRGRVQFDIDDGRRLVAQFPKGKAAIHQNHGLFTVGQTVDEAAFWFLSMNHLPGAAAGHGGRHAPADPPRRRHLPRGERPRRSPAG